MYEMLGLQCAHVRVMTDDVAERLAALWGGSLGTLGPLVEGP
ncbi:hypothetical protein [Streptomyces sp. NPDC058108]